MGRDDRGIDRGKCRVEECDCTEFVASDAISCGYCGDPPAKHQNLKDVFISDANTNPNSIEITQQQPVQGGLECLSRTSVEPWMNRKFWWIPEAKRKTGKFYNEVLKSLYKSYWPVCGDASLFRKTFIIERNRQWKYSAVLELFEDKLNYFKSMNEACAGKYLNENYIALPSEKSNVARLLDILTSIEHNVQAEIGKIRQEDDLLFCQNGLLKSGRQCQHIFNEDITFKMNLLILKSLKPLKQKLENVKECYTGTWVNKGRKRNDKQRKRENNWKTNNRAKKRKINKCKYIFQTLGGHPVGKAEDFTPAMGAFQITEMDDNSENFLSNLNSFDTECLKYMVKEGCFRMSALELVEEYM